MEIYLNYNRTTSLDVLLWKVFRDEISVYFLIFDIKKHEGDYCDQTQVEPYRLLEKLDLLPMNIDVKWFRSCEHNE